MNTNFVWPIGPRHKGVFELIHHIWNATDIVWIICGSSWVWRQKYLESDKLTNFITQILCVLLWLLDSVLESISNVTDGNFDTLTSSSPKMASLTVCHVASSIPSGSSCLAMVVKIPRSRTWSACQDFHPRGLGAGAGIGLVASIMLIWLSLLSLVSGVVPRYFWFSEAPKPALTSVPVVSIRVSLYIKLATKDSLWGDKAWGSLLTINANTPKPLCSALGWRVCSLIDQQIKRAFFRVKILILVRIIVWAVLVAIGGVIIICPCDNVWRTTKSVWPPCTSSQLSIIIGHGDTTYPWPGRPVNHLAYCREAVFRHGPEEGGRRVRELLPRNGENWTTRVRQARRLPLRHAWRYDFSVIDGSGCDSENGEDLYVWQYALTQVQCYRKRSKGKCSG